MTFFNAFTRALLPTACLASLALSGCKTSPGPIIPDGDTALRTFQTCDDLEAYVDEAILETLVRNAGGYWDIMAVDGAEAVADGGDDGPTDFTGTNNQEEGVDEIDIVKTNGTHIFSVEDGKLYITKSWPIAETELASALEIGGYARGLFLQNDTIVVVSQRWNNQEDEETDFVARNWSSTRLTFVDVSDPESPTVTRETDIEGYLTDGRMIDGKGYFAISSYLPIPQEYWDLLWNGEVELPQIDWEDSEEVRAEKREQIRDILRPLIADMSADTELTDVLPLSRDQHIGEAEAPIEALHACNDLYRPAEVSQYSVLSIVEVNIEGDSELETAGLLSDGWQVYASQDNLYVAQTSWWSWWGWGDLDMSTQIHQFNLTDTGPRYTGTGQVDGWLNDQFSFSEYDGYLRVATTDMDWWWGTPSDEDAAEAANNIFVLENQDGALTVVGEVRGIAPGERIFASRMIGEKGYLVTFRQVDPLFTIDLSDPTDPTVIGELHLPGFSSYLHPLGDDHLLAVGMDGEEDGTINGLAVNVFDVSDFANPRLAHQWTLESDDWSWSEALWDHHAFTYHRGVLTFPAYTWTDLGNGDWDYFSGAIVLDASADGIHELGRIDHRDLVAESECLHDWQCESEDANYYSYAWMRRTVYIEDNVFSLSNYGIKVNDLNSPEIEHASVIYNPVQ
jgi:hypothetical protein